VLLIRVNVDIQEATVENNTVWMIIILKNVKNGINKELA
ncbi:hypothetical protein, partial [Terribacillus sp. AE2B 122]